MSYCTQTDITAAIPAAELIQITDDHVPPVAMDTAVVAAAIASSEELINGYISGRYQLPLTNCPALLKDISVDISLYKLYMRRKKRGVPELVQKGYDNATKLLSAIASGKIQLGTTSAGAPAQASATDTVQVVAVDRVFGPGTMEDY